LYFGKYKLTFDSESLIISDGKTSKRIYFDQHDSFDPKTTIASVPFINNETIEFRDSTVDDSIIAILNEIIYLIDFATTNFKIIESIELLKPLKINDKIIDGVAGKHEHVNLMSLEYYEEHKEDLPRFPKNIGVVTALTGAALQDIIKTTRKRFNSINIYIYPAKVQGIGAEQEIIKGIETLNKIEEIDFIIAGRGGGSIEDLWAFNEEEVAIAFFNSSNRLSIIAIFIFEYELDSNWYVSNCSSGNSSLKTSSSSFIFLKLLLSSKL